MVAYELTIPVEHNIIVLMTLTLVEVHSGSAEENKSASVSSSYLPSFLCFFFLLFNFFDYSFLVLQVKFSNDKFPGSNSNLLPVCWSGGLVASRLLLTPIADLNNVKKFHVQIHQAVLFILGVTTTCIPLVQDFVWLAVVSAVQGMCDGVFFLLIGPIAIATVGVLDSSQAVGFYMGLLGLPVCAGPSLAGKKSNLSYESVGECAPDFRCKTKLL